MWKNIKSLDISNSSRNINVSTKIIKENAKLFTDFIHLVLNEAIQSGNFSYFYTGTLLTDLAKAFDCLSHELLLAKLAAYGFSRSALKLMYTYPVDRKHRTKINIFYSSWEDILSSIFYSSWQGILSGIP